MRLAFALAIALAVLATPAPAAEQLKRHSVRAEGVSLGVPNSWVAVDGRALLSQATLEELSRQNPSLAPFFRTMARSGSVLKFVALDPKLRGGFATNVNLVSVPIPGQLTFAQYQQAMLAGLQNLNPIGGIAKSVVRIGGRQALRVSFRFELTAGRTFTVQTLQYAFLHRGKSLVFTYTTVPRFKSLYAGAFAASASSIRFR
jgi:hypothetical protein